MPLILDMQKISPSVWGQFQDSSGKILDEYSVRKWTFHEGIAPEMRAEVWPFLLGYYPFLSTREEREEINEKKRLEYHRLLDSWQNGIMPDGLGEYIRVIGKDSVRTDRSHTSFSGNGEEAIENIETLNRILTTYCVYNLELGYVQGMNEFLAPLFLVLESEHQAFWCLTEVIRRMIGVFSDLTLTQPLQTLARLCYYADTQLHDHIKSIHGDDEWMFCYRAVLLNFKREFSMEDIYSLWEIIWCGHLTKQFQLFFAVAILVHYKQEILLCRTVESLMQFAMGLSCNAPLAPILTIARALTEQLKGEEYCPHELRYLVSDEGCAPPPLVGFVRARQKFSTLHSNKISMSGMLKALFGDTNQPITSPLISSSAHATPTQTSTLVSPQATPTHHHPLSDTVQDDFVMVNSATESPFSHTLTQSTPLSNGGTSHTNGTPLPTSPDTFIPTDTRNTSFPTRGVGVSSPVIGPPPRMGFVPRNMLAKKSSSGYHDIYGRGRVMGGEGGGHPGEVVSALPEQSATHSGNASPSGDVTRTSPAHSALRDILTSDSAHQSCLPSDSAHLPNGYQFHFPPPSHITQSDPPPNSLSSYVSVNSSSNNLSPHHYPLSTPQPTPLTTGPSPRPRPPQYTPTSNGRFQRIVTEASCSNGSTSSNTFRDVPLDNQSSYVWNHSSYQGNGHVHNDHLRDRSNSLKETSYSEFPRYRSTSCNKSFFGGSLKSSSMARSRADAVHYDHRNGTLSGGVFDKVEPVSNCESITGAEFDHLRSEPSLLV